MSPMNLESDIEVTDLGYQDIFGADPDVFRPERWLEAPPERRDLMGRMVDLLFGHGRYMCAGKSLAIMELNKIFVEVCALAPVPKVLSLLHGNTYGHLVLTCRDHGQLLREFDFQVINVTKPWTEEIYTNIFVSNLWMRITARQR